jgi:hypothetical protein
MRKGKGTLNQASDFAHEAEVDNIFFPRQLWFRVLFLR